MPDAIIVVWHLFLVLCCICSVIYILLAYTSKSDCFIYKSLNFKKYPVELIYSILSWLGLVFVVYNTIKAFFQYFDGKNKWDDAEVLYGSLAFGFSLAILQVVNKFLSDKIDYAYNYSLAKLIKALWERKYPDLNNFDADYYYDKYHRQITECDKLHRMFYYDGNRWYLAERAEEGQSIEEYYTLRDRIENDFDSFIADKHKDLIYTQLNVYLENLLEEEKRLGGGMMENNTEAGMRLQHQLELYLVALAFTIAGFAIQTGTFSGVLWVDLCEVFSWIAFVFSGLTGIKRLEDVTIVLRNWDIIKSAETDLIKYGGVEEHAKINSENKEALKNIKPTIEAKANGIPCIYKWQKRMLVGGLMLLILSRAVHHYLTIYQSVSLKLIAENLGK